MSDVLVDPSDWEKPAPAPALRVKCGQCRHLQGAGCCAVWLFRVVSEETDASLCQTFSERAP